MRRGVMLMMLAALAFTAMLAFVKTARQQLGPFEVVFWRGVLAVPFAYALARKQARLRIDDRRTMALRVAFGVGAMSCFYTAARELSLADLSFIAKLQPIAVAVAAPLALGRGERGSRRIWLVMAAGLVGCAFLIAPKGRAELFPALLALGGAVLSAAAHICVRHLGRGDGPAAIVFWFQLSLCAIAPLGHGITQRALLAPPPVSLWPVLLGCGLCAVVGQMLMTTAYQRDRAPTVAAASYVAALWALGGDVVIFGVWPTATDLAGGILIVAAGLYLLLGRHEAPEPEPG